MRFVAIFTIPRASATEPALEALGEVLQEDEAFGYVDLERINGGYAVTATYTTSDAAIGDIALEQLLDRIFGQRGYEQVSA